MASLKAGIGWAVGISAVLVIGAGVALLQPRPKAPEVHPGICPGALDENLDFSDLRDNQFVVQLQENCFGKRVIVPGRWSYWYADPAGEQKGQWHAYWFDNDNVPLGPFFPGRKEILGKPAHAAFRMEGRGSVIFYNTQPGPSEAIREQPKREEIPEAKTKGNARASEAVPGYGAITYATYCADCHGKDGKPPGPLALRRNLSAPDLRFLARRNKGVFPLPAVETLLTGTTQSPIMHGGIDMPVWGPVLSHGAGDRNVTAAEAAHSLARYIESLQQ